MSVWNIYDKSYDLTEFVDKHPGGKDILLKTKNEKDLTPLFETYHAFSDKEKIKKMLDVYEIKKEENKDYKKYDFTNYNKLLQIIKLAGFSNRISTKASLSYIIQNAFMLIAYCSLFYGAMFSTSSILYKCIFAFFAGLSYISLGFNVMHDSSHYAVSINSNINNILSKLWNSWGLWNNSIWFYHHVLNHHSFTGENKLDPDLYHLQPFANKEKSSNKILHNNTNYIPYVLILFPGQYIGQSISYLLSILKSKIFHISMPTNNMYDIVDMLFMFSKLFCLYKGGMIPTICYFISLNFWYHINIIFDHDTYETVIDNHYNGNDWLKLQVCNSGNFLNNNIIWTRLFGSINYQIEHHLFPNMSNVHYPTIAPIVKKFCEENNIIYINHTSLWGAYKSYLKMLKKLNS